MNSLSAKLANEQKELARLEKQSGKMKSTKWFFIYLVFLLSLIYVIDSVTSNIGNTVTSSVVNEFFVEGRGMTFNEGMAAISALTMAAMAMMLVSPFYRALSDRFGRKIFLGLNTVGMGLGLLLTFTSTSITMYIISATISGFFISHDMQVVYIMELAPPKWRGTMYSGIKCVASLGLLIIPVIRSLTMGNDPTLWRSIFLFPAILGIVVGFIALWSAPESPQFLKSRIDYLKTPPEERETVDKKGKKTESKGKGGIIPSIKFMFAHKQLRWLSITNIIYFFAMTAIGKYEPIMSSGGMSTDGITQALFVYPFAHAAITFVNGFLSDRIGRKRAVVLMGAASFTCIVLFVTGVAQGWSPYLIGGLYGAYFGGYYAAGDVLGGIMCGESAPTHMRASVMASQTLLLLVSFAISNILMIVLLLVIENLGLLCLILTAPFMLLSLIIFSIKVHETQGLDLSEVNGTEWD